MEREEKTNKFDLLPVKKEETPPAEIVKSYFENIEEEVHLWDYLDVLKRRKWIIIAFLITVVTTVTIASFLVTPIYKSTAIVQIGKENPNVLTFKDVYQVERPDEDYYETQYNVLKSRTLAKRVIEKLALDKEQEFHSLVMKIDDAGNQVKKKKIILESFFERLDVSPIKRSQLVEIAFSSRDSELAAKVSNAIAHEYIEFTLDNKLTATRQARRWLEKQIDELKGKLEDSEEKLNDYVAGSQIIFLNQEKDYESLLTQKLKELSSELGKATADRIAKEAHYLEIQESPLNNNTVLNNPLIQSLMKEYSLLESRHTELMKIYKPEYTKMSRLKEQMDSIKKRMEIETQKIINAIETDYGTALKREKNLASNIENLRKQVVGFQKKMVQYQIMHREVESNRELYNNLLQRVKEVGVSASLSASNVFILDKADVQLEPYKPKKALNIALSLIVGLFGGIFLAFFVEYLDNTIKNVEEIEKRIHMPVVGIVPLAESKTEGAVYVNPDENGTMAEAFRSLATYIQFSAVSKPPKQILVTSSLEQEGKTTLAVNIAVSLVRFMGKGIIVDADLRKPRVHKYYGLDNSVGLSSYLAGLIGKNTLIRHTSFDDLDVITAGPIPPNPSDLLGSSRMKALIDDLSSRYDFIIMDSPPVLGMSDSIVLSTFTEGVIVVAHAGKTPRDALIQSKKLLNGINAKILGAVLNRVSHKTGYAYYSYYYSGYGDATNGKKNKTA